MIELRQSTARTVQVGPFLDSTEMGIQRRPG